MPNVDWIKIKNEYITSEISQRKLAEKYEIKYSSLRYRAEKEDWNKLRENQQRKISAMLAQKTQDVIVKNEVKQIDRKYELSERLLDKLEQAIDELDISLVTNKRKTRVIEYKDDKAIGKPTKEIIDETEEILQIVSIVDRAGVKRLAGALKDIKDIQSTNDTDTTTLDRVLDVLDAVKEQAKNG